MQLAKKTMFKKLSKKSVLPASILIAFSSIYSNAVQAQENSPYSRFGLGDKTPSTNIINRGMGGVASGFVSPATINYANPASYGFFQTTKEFNSKKMLNGRMVFDVGADITGRNLINSSTKERFPATNIQFSHVMVGMPLRNNWGMAFGVRPLTSIKYSQRANVLVKDPSTNQVIDSAVANYEGSGGLNLATIGTGFKINASEKLTIAVGMNGGYIFGKKNAASRMNLHNDSTTFNGVLFENQTNYNGMYFDAGLQLHTQLSKKIFLSLGANGAWKQKLNTTTERFAGTYVQSEFSGILKQDTVSLSNTEGNIMYPSTMTFGFILEKPQINYNHTGWSIGADYTSNKWSDYRANNIADNSLKNNWQIKIGGEFQPIRKKGYFSQMNYRLGYFTGPDYITFNSKELKSSGFSLGLGMPLANYNYNMTRQASVINLAFEYLNRGNSGLPIKENIYRISIGFSLSDIWFQKRKYD